MTYEEVSKLLKSPVEFREYLIKLLKDTELAEVAKRLYDDPHVFSVRWEEIK